MIKQWVLFIVCLLGVASVQAVKMQDLYQAELPVHTQDAKERSKAVQDGLRQVLVKLTGSSRVLKNPKVKEQLARADDLVEEYAYDKAAEADKYDRFVVKVRFSQQEIDQMLQSLDIGFWGEHRPLTLVWLTVTNAEGIPEIIGNDTPTPLLNKMKSFSRYYGLPLIFPMMDMTDMAKVIPDHVVNMDYGQLKPASMRYAPDVILLGNMTYKNNKYYSEWRLIANNTHWSWGLKSSSKEKTIVDVFDQVEETLAKHYVVDNKGDEKAQTLKLHVSNITRSDDLLQLVNYLKTLKSLSGVELEQISGSRVDIQAKLRGSVESFQQNVSLDRKIALKSQDGEAKFYYEWLG